MTIHTLVYSFPDEMAEQDRETFFSEMKAVILGSGLARRFEHRHHLPIPPDQYAPVFATSAIAQIEFPDLDAVVAAFALPELEGVIGRWQQRFPYKCVWVNHEPVLEPPTEASER